MVSLCKIMGRKYFFIRLFLPLVVLSWADMVGGYVLRVMMPYLTDKRKLSLSHAGNIMNLFDGFVAIIPLAMCFLVDVFMGDYAMLLVTSLAYSFGMFFLTTTTPGSLFVGNTQIVLFYIALALIAIGRSGYKTSVRPFYGQQLQRVGLVTSDEEQLPTACGIAGGLCCVSVVGAIGLIILFYINPWSIRFGVSAGFTVIAALLFISGSSSYYPITPEGRQPNSLRTAMQYVKMMPVLIPFVVGGIICSISSGYFMEQANHLNNKLWIFKLSLPTLPLVYDVTKTRSAEKLFRRFPPEVRVANAILLSVLGCITAALVEAKRLGVVHSHGLIDKPEEQIPMSIMWLVPQFFLVAAFEGVLESSSEEYLEDKLPGSPEHRTAIFSDGVVGAGTMCSAGLVHVLRKVSERGGKPGWFQETLNESRIDNYYWTLAAVSAVTLVLYIAYLSLTCWLSSKGKCEPPFDCYYEYDSLEY